MTEELQLIERLEEVREMLKSGHNMFADLTLEGMIKEAQQKVEDFEKEFNNAQ